MKKFTYILILFCLLVNLSLFGQVGIGTNVPDSSAILELKSTQRGFLPPRMTLDQRNSIISPAEGLMVFCTDCGSDGALSVYSDGEWITFNLCITSSSTAGSNIVAPGQIIWNWTAVDNAIGYKWNSTSSYITAVDMGIDTSKTETGIVCDTTYIRSVWAYNSCGVSELTTLSQTIPASFPAIPTAGTHVSNLNSIVWKWNTIADGIGYKWNTVNDFGTGIDIDSDTSRTESGLTCDSIYTRYLWVYNGCGYSTPLTLSQSTLECRICGNPFTINHLASGGVAPVDKSVSYGTVTYIPGEPSKCWITSNLGSDHQATSKDDATEASAGWYWQFNRMQGYKYDGSTITPTWNSTIIDENSDWIAVNDPCAIELGSGWRIPTYTEWTNVYTSASWTNWNGPWNSDLKLHAAGYISTGYLYERGIYALYWSSSQSSANSAWLIGFWSGLFAVQEITKNDFGSPLRCLKDLQPSEQLIVTSDNISDITHLSATSGGDVISDGGDAVIARGVCWSTSPNPTTANNHTIDGTGSGAFVSNITDLLSNTDYYVRAYATNSIYTAYGNEVMFTTLEIPGGPTVNTDPISDITQTSAICGGDVTDEGDSPVTARGVCWSTLSYATIADNHTTDGSGTGMFVSSLTGLIAHTQYFVRAYATNNAGTVYGNEVSFTAGLLNIGQSYGGGIIFYFDGTGMNGLIAATEDQSTGAPWGCMYTSIPGTSTAIGTGQANTTAVVNGCSDEGIAARICNDLVMNGYDDWFLPSKDELNEMVHQINTVGLSNTTYWSSSETEGVINAWALQYDDTQWEINKDAWLWVRAIRAFSEEEYLPNVTTTGISEISQITATSGGDVNNGGAAPVTSRGVCWSTSANPTIADNFTTDGSGSGIFVSGLTGLVEHTLYYVRAYATNSVGTAYGNEVSFKTNCNSITINHTAGSVAPVTKTVTYGTFTNVPGEPSKCWITSNLGSDHQATSKDDATEASAGWYWQFNRMQGYKHDGATRTPYTTWIASIDENLDWQAANDPCTLELGSGWRIPTSTEWTNVYTGAGWTNWNGPWNSDLKMHAAGILNAIDGSLVFRGSTGYYWSGSQYSNTFGSYLNFGSGHCYIDDIGKTYGFTIRCLIN